MSRPSRRGKSLPLPTAEAGTDNGSDGIDWTTGGVVGGTGVTSVSATGDPELTGDVTLSAGTNVTLTQVGQDIEIAAASAGSTITTKDEGTTLSTGVTTLDFVGAGVTASGAGATTTITISGGGGGGSGPAYVQHLRANGNNLTGFTLPSTPTNGNVLVGAMACNGNQGTSITQTGVTWTRMTHEGEGGVGQWGIWRGVVGSSASASATIAGTSGPGGMLIVEYSGLTFTTWNSTTLHGQLTTATQSSTAHQASVAGRVFVFCSNSSGSTPTAPPVLNNCDFVYGGELNAPCIGHAIGVARGAVPVAAYHQGQQPFYTFGYIT